MCDAVTVLACSASSVTYQPALMTWRRRRRSFYRSGNSFLRSWTMLIRRAWRQKPCCRPALPRLRPWRKPGMLPSRQAHSHARRCSHMKFWQSLKPPDHFSQHSTHCVMMLLCQQHAKAAFLLSNLHYIHKNCTESIRVS